MVKRKTVKDSNYKITFIWDGKSERPFISMFVYKRRDDEYRYFCSHEFKVNVNKNKLEQRFNNLPERTYTESDITRAGYSNPWSAAQFRAKDTYEEYNMAHKFPVK